MTVVDVRSRKLTPVSFAGAWLLFMWWFWTRLQAHASRLSPRGFKGSEEPPDRMHTGLNSHRKFDSASVETTIYKLRNCKEKLQRSLQFSQDGVKLHVSYLGGFAPFETRMPPSYAQDAPEDPWLSLESGGPPSLGNLRELFVDTPKPEPLRKGSTKRYVDHCPDLLASMKHRPKILRALRALSIPLTDAL